MTTYPVDKQATKPAAPAFRAAAPAPTGEAPPRPPYRMALFVALGTLLLYALTLAPTTQFWDTSEYIAAAKVLGIPHPPGNPLFVLVAHVWGMLPLAAGYAARINLLAAVTSAISAACWFLVTERWLRSIVPARWPRRLAALAAALVSATAFTVWNQSVVNEKVYTLSLLSIALILWLIVRWDDQPPGQAHDHHLLLIAYLLALTATNHMMGVLAGPVAVVLLFPPLKSHRPSRDEDRRIEWSQWAAFTSVWAVVMTLGLESPAPIVLAGLLYAGALAYAVHARNWSFALVMLAVAVVGLSVYASLPIRAAHFPPINEGEPTTWQSFWDVLTRKQYGKPSVFDDPTYPPGPGNPGRSAELLVAQVGMWWQYFSWQWGHDWAPPVRQFLAVIFLALGGLGAWRHWAADRRSALAMTALVGFLTVLLIFYLNFKYGYSWDLDRRDLAREVRERDYFYIGSFAVWGIWVGMGLATLMEWVQQGLAARVPDEPRRWTLATPVLLIALIPLAGNRLTASRAGETLARDFAADLLQTVEPYGVLVTAGDNDTFPLWYAQEVEGIRQDVTVVNLSLANTDWYLRQIQRRPVIPFDSAAAPAFYQARHWPHPEGPLMNVSDGWLAALQPYYILPEKQTVELGPLRVTLDPDLLQRGYIERADVIVLQIIRDQLGRRPIYFSRTVGYYADQFGLSEYLEGQGFARKLHPAPLAPSDSIEAVPSLGFVNVPRTTALLFDVYHAETAARPRPRGWVDHPSEGIINLYGLTYQTLAVVLRDDDPPLATRALLLADSIFANTSARFVPPTEVER
ncbi:MAG: glycosyltransferase family 117 protein [Gemmatimonadales bacterium]